MRDVAVKLGQQRLPAGPGAYRQVPPTSRLLPHCGRVQEPPVKAVQQLSRTGLALALLTAWPEPQVPRIGQPLPHPQQIPPHVRSEPSLLVAQRPLVRPARIRPQLPEGTVTGPRKQPLLFPPVQHRGPRRVHESVLQRPC